MVDFTKPSYSRVEMSTLAHQIYALLNEARYLRAQYPDLANYRGSDVVSGLEVAFKGADHLARGEQYHEWDAVISTGAYGIPPDAS